MSKKIYEHIISVNYGKITEKVKAFQKPKRDNRSKNKGVRG